jgi:hypothetical protein
MIAAETSGDDVVPAFLPTRRDGNDVIECQIFGWELLPAILTRIVVAGIDVGAGELYSIVVFDTDVLEEPNN